MGDERTVAGPPGKRPTLSSAARGLLMDDFDVGDERTVAGPPGKRPKLSSAALLARLLRPDMTFTLIGNHPQHVDRDDPFASSLGIRHQLPPILKKAHEFDDDAYSALMKRTISHDVNRSGDNTVAWLRWDGALLLLDLFDADAPTRALGMGVCIDKFEQLGFDWELLFDSGKNAPVKTAPLFGDNVNISTRTRPADEFHVEERTISDYKVHMRPETYAGANLCAIQFVAGGPFGQAKALKTVVLAIAAHPKGVEGGLAKYLRENLVHLIRCMSADDLISSLPPHKIHRVDVTRLKAWIKRNKPTTTAVARKEKRKAEPGQQPKAQKAKAA